MNKTELTKLNVGYNLDWLMNLDPRGYGVCRILPQREQLFSRPIPKMPVMAT